MLAEMEPIVLQSFKAVLVLAPIPSKITPHLASLPEFQCLAGFNFQCKTPKSAHPEPKSCIFEHIYFSLPNSIGFGMSVYESRRKFGEILATEAPVDCDVVIAVPDSGVVAALGYAAKAGVPFQQGLIRSHYVGQTFIEPSQRIRDFGVKPKLSPFRLDMYRCTNPYMITDKIIKVTLHMYINVSNDHFCFVNVGMGKMRSMNRKKKHDDAMSKNPIKTCDNNSGTTRPWSDLTHDVLNLVMMKLGVVDFYAFIRVCKSWRSLAVSNRNKFLVSKPPMSISISFNYFKGRKLKTVLAERTCVGRTCGYLILYDEKGREFLLVNPITRHELHFPNSPIEFCSRTSCFRGILVFSPSRSEWVFVVFNIWLDHSLWFCIAGKQEWTKVYTTHICDLIAFKGKIYTLHYSYFEVKLCEMKLHSEPELVILISNPRLDFRNPRFVSCGENLYAINRVLEHPYKIHQLDIDEMKWVSSINTQEKYAFFRDDDFYSYTLREVWADIHSQYGRYAVNDEMGKCVLFHAKMWYFFYDCLNVNLIHE
ncbi:hypothetical protein LXL04_038141 [Taraxacum kok-saghyz]